jgi:hypothetical protein
MQPAKRARGLWLINVTDGRMLLVKSGAGFGRADVNNDGVVALPEHADASVGTVSRARMDVFRLDFQAIGAVLKRQ